MGGSRYVVRQLGWHQPPHGDPYTRRMPTAVPVARFGTFDVADEHRRDLERTARAGENPFRFGGCSVFFQSSLDAPRLHDWLMDEGIDPPAGALRHAEWHAWWAAFAHTWTEHQLNHAWSAFDKVRFYDVAEEPPDAAHVVVEVVWGLLERDWNAMTAGTEGGRLRGVHRRAGAAERARAALNHERTAGGGRYRFDRRLGYDADPHAPLPARHATFYETLAVPSDVPPHAGTGFLVQRRALADSFAGMPWRTRPPADARVPVALFASRVDAVEHRDRLAAECRQALNPFVFADPADGAATADGREELLALDLPLPLPSGDRRRDWVEWWDLCQDDASDDQRAAVWRATDRPLFEVLGVEVGDG